MANDLANLSEKHKSGWIYDPPEPPPPGAPWVDCLRWLVAVMDASGHMAFVAGCLAYALDHDGRLTEKQAAACQRVMDHVGRSWQHGTLACQLAHDHPLRDVPTKGNA